MQRVSLTILGGALLLTGLASSNPVEVKAAEPVKDTIKLTVKFPDTVGEGFGVEPTNPDEIHDMVDTEGRSNPERTGWSAMKYTCIRTDTPYIVGYDYRGNPIWDVKTVSGWRQGEAYSTIDSHVPHQPSEVRKEIVEQYGQDLYDLAEASGAIFYYDETTPIPKRFLTGPLGEYNLRVNGTHGRYSIYYKDTTYTGRHCENGEKAYFYRNNDFFVTAEFDVFWKEPEDKKGNALGRAYWELERTDKNAPSEVAVFSEFKGEYEKHVAVRNIKHIVDIGSKHVEQESPIQFHINAKQVKGTDMKYSFRYEYTNKKIGWVCTGEGESRSCYWNDNPDWRAVQEFKLNGSIPVDHQQEETEKWDTLDNVLKKKWVVGREDKWNPGKSSKVFHEEYKRSSSNKVPTSFDLKTQSTLPILQGAIDYSVELPSGKQKESSFDPLRKEKSTGYYFPADVDDSLKSQYANTTKYGYSYAFPLQQHVMNDKGTSGDKRSFTMDYTTDLFMISQHTGYLAGAPYANAVKQSVISNSALPSVDTYINQGKSNVQSGFQSSTGQQFIDTVLFTNSASLDKLQRYYLPVDPKSTLHPNETYNNHIAYENMGLSDAIFEFDQTFKFGHYLFGSAANDAWIVEQVDSRTSMKTLNPGEIHKVHISREQMKKLINAKTARTDVQMHSFRFSDRDYMDKVKSIVGY